MAVFDVKNLSTAFGNLSLTSMRFYTGLNVKIIIDILNFYFYFITKDKLIPKPGLIAKTTPQLFQIFNFNLMNWKSFKMYYAICQRSPAQYWRNTKTVKTKIQKESSEPEAKNTQSR